MLQFDFLSLAGRRGTRKPTITSTTSLTLRDITLKSQLFTWTGTKSSFFSTSATLLEFATVSVTLEEMATEGKHVT